MNIQVDYAEAYENSEYGGVEVRRLKALLRQINGLPPEIALCGPLSDRLTEELSDRPTEEQLDRAAAVTPACHRAGWHSLFKVMLDRSLAAAAVVLLAPLLGAIALAVRLDSPGPSLFRQERDGLNGRIFRVLKFRSMRMEASTPGLRQTVQGDPRCSRLGRFLRRSSLDELPQLFNVLCGDMSLVGPRPHAVDMRTEHRLGYEIVPGYALRHRVRPGITGLAQVSGLRGATHTAEQLRARVECDLDYINGWSLALDMRILGRTVLKVFSPTGAF